MALHSDRQSLIQQWLKAYFAHSNFNVTYQQGDASFRRYARITTEDQSYILMDADPEKDDCRPFVSLAQFFRQNQVNVPQIFAQDLDQGFLLLEDFGDQLLSQVLNDDSVDAHYLQAIKQLLEIQAIDVESTDLVDYDQQKLTVEMQEFDQWFLPYLSIKLTSQQQQLLEAQYQILVDRALAQPQVIVHRDYHSRNLMQINQQPALGVIDFQDAIIGPQSYDLMSLIRDAYILWPIDKVASWIDLFWQHLPAEKQQLRSLADFRQDADFIAAQRHLKILGRFVRLKVRDGKDGYIKDLPLVMHYLVNEIAPYAELKPLHDLLTHHVLPQFVNEIAPDHPLFSAAG